MRRPEDLFGANRRQKRRRLGIGAIVALVLFLASIFRGSAVFYTDWLWFQSVDLPSIFTEVLLTKVGLGAAGFLLFFGLVWLNLYIVDRFAPQTVSSAPEDEMARRYQEFVRPRAGRVRTVAAVVLGFFAGAGFYVNWQDFILFRNGGDFGINDPQFGMDVGFFMFQLPFITTVLSWVFYALVLTVIVSLIAHFLQGAIRPQAPANRITTAVKTHASVLLGVLAIVRAVQYYFDRYLLNFSDRGVTKGANYTDVNFALPAYFFLIAISLTAAAVLFAASRRRGWSLPAVTVSLWLVVSILIVNVIPLGVQQFSVVPAESAREAPYIERNIEATRAALDLDRIEMHDFEYTEDLDGENLENNAQTVRNVRLWDPTYLKPSYTRLQENRSFFQFDDIDIDRYVLDGELTQVELAVRELNIDGLPQDRRSWVNQHLQYTHGYGAVMSTANAVTADGKPVFTLKDVPPNGIPAVETPQVYFGERTSPYSIVGTDQVEVDYVSAEGRDETSSYEGEGGVELSNIVKRAAFAARVGDINPLISELVTSDSKAMYLTNIRERANKVAPFLKLDNDPYPVIMDGRIKWIHDAYTTSANYPSGENADVSLIEADSGLSNQQFNYLRSSVKIVTDAYDGEMTFYNVDDEDPVIAAWSKAFPDLFTPGDEVPDEMREHFRYPEDMFRVQATMFGRYHLDNSGDFYSQSDRWNIAQKPQTGTAVSTTSEAPVTTVPGPPIEASTAPAGETRIEPYFLLMRLPGEDEMSFLMFQPYVPFSRNDERRELSAFLTAKSDPQAFGQMDAYVMPRDQQVDGPALVDGRIQQDPEIAQQVTLLSQGGARVDYGNMLIIPIDNGLMYVRPLYVTARGTQVPEFAKAIVVQGDQIAMEDTLQESLAEVFGSAPETLEEDPGAQDSPQPDGEVVPDGVDASNPEVQQRLDEANDAFSAADAALREGDLARYQSEIARGIELVREAREL